MRCSSMSCDCACCRCCCCSVAHRHAHTYICAPHTHEHLMWVSVLRRWRAAPGSCATSAGSHYWNFKCATATLSVRSGSRAETMCCAVQFMTNKMPTLRYRGGCVRALVHVRVCVRQIAPSGSRVHQRTNARVCSRASVRARPKPI